MKQNYSDKMRETIAQYKESGCCTVVALACSLDWSFGKAHRHMTKHGRKNRQGVALMHVIPALANAVEKSNKQMHRIKSAEGLTIGRFARENPKGVFYVLVNRHALAIVDGVMQDWTASTAGRRKILNCYKIEG